MSTSATPQVRSAYPTFTAEHERAKDPEPTITRREAANRLGITYDQLANKFLASGLLTGGERLSSDQVDDLVARPYLRATSGELSVLRTSGRTDAPPTPKVSRRFDAAESSDGYFGISVDDTDAGLASRSLKWLRTRPSRILDNRLYVATTGEFPIAVWEIDEVDARADEEFGRTAGGKPVRGDIVYMAYSGPLLARLRRRNAPEDGDRPSGSEIPQYEVLFDNPTFDYVAVYDANRVKKGTALYSAIETIMTSRIKVSGGSSPVNYLTADE